jgi:Amt family ammonium transporter
VVRLVRFNPGSTLSAMDFEGIGRVATNTTLAASAAGLVAMFVAYPRANKWDTGISINGFLAGLVAITCPCYWVSPFGAICIGAIAGVVVILGIDLLEYLRIDDPIGAWPVHGLCGMWGTWALGLFATGQYGGDGARSRPLASFKGLLSTAVALPAAVPDLGASSSAYLRHRCWSCLVKALGVLRILTRSSSKVSTYEHGTPPTTPSSPMGFPVRRQVEPSAAAS